MLTSKDIMGMIRTFGVGGFWQVLYQDAWLHLSINYQEKQQNFNHNKKGMKIVISTDNPKMLEVLQRSITGPYNL